MKLDTYRVVPEFVGRDGAGIQGALSVAKGRLDNVSAGRRLGWSGMSQVTLDFVRQVAAGDRYLAVVTATRSDGSVHGSVVNAGILAHPVSGEAVVGFVTYARTKLRLLRARPTCTVTFRSGPLWASVEGKAEIMGPDDPPAGLPQSEVPRLLRDVFVAAGGQHDDWNEYDRVMAAERRAVVLVHPRRIYSN
jgi:PPOX class probable F420-dependent enzyme